MTLSEAYQEYTRRLEESLRLRTEGQTLTQSELVEAHRQAEDEADQWLRKHFDKQDYLPI